MERMIVLGERALYDAIRQYLSHYHTERNHQGLDNRLIALEGGIGDQMGHVVRRERLGGVLSYYHREAALRDSVFQPNEVSVPGVEACRLDRKPGGARSAIVLLNWTAMPQSSITLTVSNTTATSARSVERGPLPAQANPVLRQLEVTLPITDVDIVLLD